MGVVSTAQYKNDIDKEGVGGINGLISFQSVYALNLLRVADLKHYGRLFAIVF